MLFVGFACEVKNPSQRAEPASFRVTMVCAGNTASDCPHVTAGTALCPTSPTAANIGTPSKPVAREQLFYVAQVEAIHSSGTVDSNYAGTANVYVMFDGSVSPTRSVGVPPLAKLPFTNGQACLATAIPPAFNQTQLWVEDSGGGTTKPSFAIGVSKAIYRPSPLISDVQRTTDANLLTSPVNGKHVLIEGGTNGGALVVTATFSQYFTVTDVGTPGADHPWGSLEVYSYSQPFGVHVGSIVRNLNGAVSPFNGLNELSFPVWEVDPSPPDVSRVPAPHVVQVDDLPKTLDAMGPFVSALVAVKEWSVCALPDGGRDATAYAKYGQWKVAPSTSLAADGSCSDSKSSMSVLSAATVSAFKPLNNVGRKFCSLTGVLSHVAPGVGIHLWMITPRDSVDLGQPVDAAAPCN
jgi:hypothetical protein